MGMGGANFQPSQQSSQPSGPPRMGGKGGGMGGGYTPSRQQFGPPNMGGKGGGMGGGYGPRPMPNMGGKGGGMRGGFDDSGMGGGYGPRGGMGFNPYGGGERIDGGGYGPQGGFGGFGPQQPPQFSPDTMNQINAMRDQKEAIQQQYMNSPAGQQQMNQLMALQNQIRGNPNDQNLQSQFKSLSDNLNKSMFSGPQADAFRAQETLLNQQLQGAQPQSPGPGAPPPPQAFQDFQAQQQMPNMGSKGGPQQLPQGMGGYMQQMAMNRYAMQPQFSPNIDQLIDMRQHLQGVQPGQQMPQPTPQQAQYIANEGYRSIPAAPRAPMTQQDYQNAQNRMGQLFGMPTSAFSQFTSNAQARQPQTLNDMYGNMATLPKGYARDSSGNVVFSDAGISLPPGAMLARGGIASLAQ